MADKAEPAGRVVGEVVDAELALLKPNGWNPNKLSARKYASLKRGFREEGWLRSQAMTIWRTDHRGRVMNLIIDGEHRWKGGIEIGMTHGPAIFLDGLTLAQAKKLTVKLDGRRGEFDSFELATLVASVREDSDTIGVDDALELGLEDDEYAALLASVAGDPIGDGASPPAPIAKTKWAVLVEVANERAQARLLARFKREGLKCRSL